MLSTSLQIYQVASKFKQPEKLLLRFAFTLHCNQLGFSLVNIFSTVVVVDVVFVVVVLGTSLAAKSALRFLF